MCYFTKLEEFSTQWITLFTFFVQPTPGPFIEREDTTGKAMRLGISELIG